MEKTRVHASCETSPQSTLQKMFCENSKVCEIGCCSTDFCNAFPWSFDGDCWYSRIQLVSWSFHEQLKRVLVFLIYWLFLLEEYTCLSFSWSVRITLVAMYAPHEKPAQCGLIHLLLFITRKYTIINAKLRLTNAEIHSFYSMDIYWCRYATICIKGHSISPTDDH